MHLNQALKISARIICINDYLPLLLLLYISLLISLSRFFFVS